MKSENHNIDEIDMFLDSWCLIENESIQNLIKICSSAFVTGSFISISYTIYSMWEIYTAKLWRIKYLSLYYFGTSRFIKLLTNPKTVGHLLVVGG